MNGAPRAPAGPRGLAARSRGAERDVPSFQIVGTPRSGTTLVQRLACEIPGIRVPPETHFFSLFALGLMRRRRFPLEGDALRGELGKFLALETSRGLDLETGTLFERLAGSCDSPVTLFGAIVRELTGDATLSGEKTPDHLLWWAPLCRALPQLKIVAVVRDPRAVVASNLSVPWGMEHHVVLSQRWASDQQVLFSARSTLGPDRCLLLRYEDVVADPHGTRAAMAGFLLRAEAVSGDTASGSGVRSVLSLPWEQWKQRAVGPITMDRVDAWRTTLTADQAETVAAVCERGMRRLGYIDGGSSRLDSLLRMASLSPGQQWRRLHFLAARRRMLRRISHASVLPISRR